MDVVTIGETMVLFTPESEGPMKYATTFTKRFGGAESNFSIGLTRLGCSSGWISSVGNDEFGKSMIAFIRGEGVDVSQVKIDPEAKTGIYFKEIRNPNDIRVEYYRSDSAASRMSKELLSEEYIAQAKYLHISGITPALSDSCYEMILEAIMIAKKHSLKIIFDPNLRRKLWSEERARRVLLEITSLVDIVLPGLDEGTFMFGEKDPETLGELFLQQGPELVILKVGAQGAYFFTHDERKLVDGYIVENIVDPVGAGDGFAAGFVSGLVEGLPIEDAVKRGNAVGAMVVMSHGDVEGLPDMDDIKSFLGERTEQVNR